MKHEQVTVNIWENRREVACLHVQRKAIETWKHIKYKRACRSRRNEKIRLLVIFFPVLNLNLEHVNVLHYVKKKCCCCWFFFFWKQTIPNELYGTWSWWHSHIEERKSHDVTHIDWILTGIAFRAQDLVSTCLAHLPLWLLWEQLVFRTNGSDTLFSKTPYIIGNNFFQYSCLGFQPECVIASLETPHKYNQRHGLLLLDFSHVLCCTLVEKRMLAVSACCFAVVQITGGLARDDVQGLGGCWEAVEEQSFWNLCF